MPSFAAPVKKKTRIPEGLWRRAGFGGGAARAPSPTTEELSSDDPQPTTLEQLDAIAQVYQAKHDGSLQEPEAAENKRFQLATVLKDSTQHLSAPCQDDEACGACLHHMPWAHVH